MQDASKIIKEMVTLIYLVGGAPARGTEIGLLQVGILLLQTEMYSCTEGDARSLHFTEKLKGGAITAVTRHLDETSSRLLKAYLVLARPWIIVLSRA